MAEPLAADSHTQAATDQIRDEHGHIRSTLIATGQALRRLTAAQTTLDAAAAQLALELAHLAEQSRLHFRAEELLTLFPLLEQRLPSSGEEVELLRVEHGDLEEILARARRFVEIMRVPELGELMTLLDSFTEVLARHEAKEESLLRRLRDALAESSGA